MKNPSKTYTVSQALEKARKWCAIRERCHQEVRDKLRKWGMQKYQCEEIIAELIEQNFLNEERFARAFARGKFRMKKWGKIKIIHELKKKNISKQCIQYALQEIDSGAYIHTLISLTEKKLRQHSARANNRGNKAYPYRATYRYLIHKGYEPELVRHYLNEKKKTS